MVTQARVHLGELDQWARFLPEHQRREAQWPSVQPRHEFQDAMTEAAMSFISIQQEFHGRGVRREQLRQLVHNGLMRQMEDLQIRLERDETCLMQATQENDRFSNETCNAVKLRIDEQKDQREMLRNLAQQVETLRSRSNPGAVPS